MTTAFAKRIEKLEEMVRARSDSGPIYCRRMEDEDEADALERLAKDGIDVDHVVFIVRAIVDPPERPADEVPAIPASPSARTVQATRMAAPELRRQITYPRDGSVV